MGYFMIDLPAERKAMVRFGKITKKSLNFFDLFRRKGHHIDERTGYIVKISPDAGDGKIYHLLKSREGQWLREGDAGFRIAEEDATSLAIKAAIDEYENRKRK